MLLKGIDPLAHRRSERAKAAGATTQAMTFSAVSDLYIAAHEKAWRNPKHGQ